MLAPQLAENSIARVKLVIGRMPGTIGTSIPALTQASRKRKKVSTSKTNWVMAEVAQQIGDSRVRAIAMKPSRAASLASAGIASSRLPSTTSTSEMSCGTFVRNFSR